MNQTDQEREDLDALTKSPGWLRLTQWARQEFAEQLAQHTEHAADGTDDLQALHKLRQVIAAKRAVELVLAWPATRIKAVTPHPQPISLSRRGGL